MKFIIIVWATFFARVTPVSTRAKPACMNMTRNPVMSVHMMLMATRLWPAKSATSTSVGLPASLAVTSAMPPVAVPPGSGFGGGAGAGAAAAAGAAGGAGFWSCALTAATVAASTSMTASVFHVLFIVLSVLLRVFGRTRHPRHKKNAPAGRRCPCHPRRQRRLAQCGSNAYAEAGRRALVKSDTTLAQTRSILAALRMSSVEAPAEGSSTADQRERRAPLGRQRPRRCLTGAAKAPAWAWPGRQANAAGVATARVPAAYMSK